MPIPAGIKKSQGGKGGGGGGGSHTERKLDVQKPITSSRQRTLSTSSSADQHKTVKTSKKATEVHVLSSYRRLIVVLNKLIRRNFLQEPSGGKQLQLFSHLQQFDKDTNLPWLNIG